jgi:hypothetical protein
LGVGAGAGMICCQLLQCEHFEKLYAICSNSVNRSSTLTYSDAG